MSSPVGPAERPGGHLRAKLTRQNPKKSVTGAIWRIAAN